MLLFVWQTPGRIREPRTIQRWVYTFSSPHDRLIFSSKVFLDRLAVCLSAGELACWQLGGVQRFFSLVERRWIGQLYQTSHGGIWYMNMIEYVQIYILYIYNYTYNGDIMSYIYIHILYDIISPQIRAEINHAEWRSENNTPMDPTMEPATHPPTIRHEKMTHIGSESQRSCPSFIEVTLVGEFWLNPHFCSKVLYSHKAITGICYYLCLLDINIYISYIYIYHIYIYHIYIYHHWLTRRLAQWYGPSGAAPFCPETNPVESTDLVGRISKDHQP